ncbi:Asp23/Gls24 family envelope stress response protein [Pseudonocardia lacus]|uniref:Asp23/Gls24 family envelope stress response protein n=1 Tax=Pseudonocardia lacus TaxID=2835865 RepID=UPI001BDBEF59|nr:Asp23/Gls24 family envelope stress response protein [Pseudonocardia lacus]
MSSPAAVPLEDVGERGHLDVQPIVLRRIVEFAADSVPGTLRHERRLAGIDVGEAGASARVSVGSGDPLAVDVRLELTLRYPAPVRAVIEAVRAKVGEELTRIAGFHVRTMTVTVVGLREPPTPTARTRTPL